MLCVRLLPALGLAGCLVNSDLYERRLAALTDGDGDGVTPEQGDCDDRDPARFPGAGERCDDGIDNDCDGLLDDEDDDVDGVAYLDADGDGHGDASSPVAACTPPEGAVAADDDCDDMRADVSPSQTEACDGIDNDCDGSPETPEEVEFRSYFADNDGDGYGTGEPMMSCSPVSGAVENDLDCDDADPASYPDAIEVLDGVDQDCSGEADDLIAERDGIVLAYDGAAVRLGEAVTWLDIDGSGVSDHLLVGGPGDPTPTAPCAVLLVAVDELSTAGLESAEVLQSGLGEGCGAALATLPDADAFVVSASRADVGDNQTGRVDLFDTSSQTLLGSWSNRPGDRIGETLVDLGDVDGDGVEDVGIAAPAASDARSRSGAVWGLSTAATGSYLEEEALFEIRGESAEVRFGEGIAGGIDVNGDGYDDFAGGSSEMGTGGTAALFYGGTSLPSALSDAETLLEGSLDTGIGERMWLLDEGDEGDEGPGWLVGAPQATGGQGFVARFDATLTGTLRIEDADAVLSGGVGRGVGQVFLSLKEADRVVATVEEGIVDQASVQIFNHPWTSPSLEVADADATLGSAALGTALGSSVAEASGRSLLAVGAPVYDGQQAGAILLLPL